MKESIVIDTMDMIFKRDDKELLLILKAIGKLYKNNKKIKNLKISGIEKEKVIALNVKLGQLTNRENKILITLLSGMLRNDTPLLEL